jgi:hypothetical protein
MPTEKQANLPVVDLPVQSSRTTVVENLAAITPVLFVVVLLLTLGLARLFRRGRSNARRSMRWFFRYWQSFFGVNYNPSSKSSLRKRHSRPPQN